MSRWSNPVRFYLGLPAGVYAVFAARIVNALGFFVYPFLTLFLTTKLGMSEAATGFFVMVAATIGVPGAFVGGKLADHMSRRNVFLLGMTLSALALLPCAFLGTSPAIPWLILAASFLGGFAGPAQQAMVTDLTNRENRKATFSLLYLGHNIGFAVGPMIAGLLFANHLSWIFLGDALTTLLSVAVIAWFVKEPARHTPNAEAGDATADLPEEERAETGGLFPALMRRPLLLLTSLVLMAESFVYSQHIYTLPIQLNLLFGDDQGAKVFGSLMSVNAATVVIFTSILTALTLRLRSITVMALGGLLYAVGFGMIYGVHSVWFFVVSTFIWTLGEILISTNSHVFIADNTPISHRGRFNAVLDTIAGAGFALSPLITGMWVNPSNIRSAWVISFFLAAGAAALMFLLGATLAKPTRAGTTEPASGDPLTEQA